MDSIKLQKYFSDCGIMSRRAAEEEIKKGLVRVNGEVAELGLRIDPERDTVEYKGRRVTQSKDDKCYILLNKPRGFVTTLSDEKGRKTVFELVADVGRRVYPVGRLDMDSDGMLILTDDGDLTNRLTHPKHEIPKIYHVSVYGEVREQTLDALSQPMILDGYEILPVKVSSLGYDGSVTLLEFTLYEGRNRQIRKMCDTQALRIKRLCRVAIGKISLGDLEVGKWRYLTESEVEYLKN
ncbi:MAG: rRNA pseudouridine synthase [Clostridia bacterium]|nr:rRNA pseudouridine synthase [Clostridia bacterium]